MSSVDGKHRLTDAKHCLFVKPRNVTWRLYCEGNTNVTPNSEYIDPGSMNYRRGLSSAGRLVMDSLTCLSTSLRHNQAIGKVTSGLSLTDNIDSIVHSAVATDNICVHLKNSTRACLCRTRSPPWYYAGKKSKS
jgi:hypothetical protein